MANENVAATVDDSPSKARRDDLSFTRREQTGSLCNWFVSDPEEYEDQGRARGARFFDEVVELAAVDEHEAYCGVIYAIQQRDTFNPGRSVERGFIDAVACAAMVGLRALRHETENPFDPDRARESSLETERDILKAQLESLGVAPWRTIEQAGFDKPAKTAVAE